MQHIGEGEQSHSRGTALDVRRVRRGFERAAQQYSEAARIEHMIGAALLEHLEGVRFVPQRILDLGAGTGTLLRALRRHYRKAQIIGLDLTLKMLREVHPARISFLRSPRLLCANAERVPLKAGSVDMVVSAGLLQWCRSPETVISECARLLRPGGLLALATIGPDTLQELREICESLDTLPHVHRFDDMHDIGDALVQEGFTGVVMDADRMTLKYHDVDELFAELRAHGAMNAALDRRKTMAGRTLQTALRRRYESLRDADGVLPVSCEAVYAHAWRPEGDERRVTFSPRLPA